MVNKYRIELDRDNCIGSTGCAAVDPANWSLALDGKIRLKDSKDNGTGFFCRVIDEFELPKWIESAKACPVLVIHITDMQTGKRVV